MTPGTSSSGSPSLPPPPPPDSDALARFAVGESSVDEAATVRAWLEANAGDRELVDALRDSTGSGLPGDLDVEAALARVRHRMNDRAERMPMNAPSHRTVRSISAARGWRIAAAATVLAAAGIVAIAVATQRSHPASGPFALARQYRTSVGQRDSVLLADGSRVVLGPDSRLDVPAGYGVSARNVELHGDALFTVRHDAASPFTLTVGHAIIEDIGTTFVVESDAGSATRVSVVAGSVRLRRSGSPVDAGVALAAGDRGTVDLTGIAHAERHAAVADDMAWTTGRLVFRNASLAQIAGELHRWYGVLLTVGDSSLVDRHVSTTVDSGQPVDDVLRNIGLSLDARIERHGDSATITAIHGSAAIR